VFGVRAVTAARAAVERAVARVRRVVYALGLRPRPGSILYSPSRALLGRPGAVAAALAVGMDEEQRRLDRVGWLHDGSLVTIDDEDMPDELRPEPDPNTYAVRAEPHLMRRMVPWPELVLDDPAPADDHEQGAP